MTDMDSNVSKRDRAVTLDSGWVADGHTICWNGPHGAFFGHPDHCPYYVHNKIRNYLCSPGCAASDYGIALDNLPKDEYYECAEHNIGSEAIQWRLQEVIHPDLTVKESMDMCVFQIKLDVEDERND